MAKKGQYQIPFDQSGRPLSYAASREQVDWRDNHEFEAEVTFDGFSRGRSAANSQWKDTARPNTTYTMFLKELGELISADEISDTLQGRWTFVKRGTNYGIRLVEKL